MIRNTDKRHAGGVPTSTGDTSVAGTFWQLQGSGLAFNTVRSIDHVEREISAAQSPYPDHQLINYSINKTV
jgi:hypothetical protein